jgi:hypothetical protein
MSVSTNDTCFATTQGFSFHRIARYLHVPAPKDGS